MNAVNDHGKLDRQLGVRPRRTPPGESGVRDSIERALQSHGIEYSPPLTDERPTWLLATRTGLEEATTEQAKWFCIGLAVNSRGARS